MAMKETTKAIFAFLQDAERKGESYTAADVAEELGLNKRSVECSFTAAIQRRGYGRRIEAEVVSDDGEPKKVKILQITEKGMDVDLDAE